MTTPPSDRGRILIVDDDQKVLDLLNELLGTEGYEVAAAANGADAFDLAVSFEPDIVISDVVMPVVDGLELCRRLKKDQRTSNVPVLLISGVQTSPDDSMRGLYAGANDYLTLPFRNEELMVKVARLAERHRVEKHYRQLVEQAVDIIYTRDMEGYITSINESGARFFGRPTSELVGQHLGELIDAACADRDVAETKRLDGSSPLRSTYCLRDANGDERYLEGVITVQRDPAGQPTGVRGVVRDITDQKLAEEALREAETRLRTVVGSASLILFAVDRNGIFTLNEGEGLKSLGLSPGALVGQSIFEVYAGNPKVGENIRRALAGESFTSAVEVGDLFFEVRYSPLIDHKSRVQGVIGVAIDITDHRKAEVAICESEERYRELFENANDIIYTHDLAGNFTSLNRSGERITGYSREEAATMNVSDVIAPEYLSLAREMIAHKESENVSTVYEIDVISKTGQRVRLEVSTRLILRDGKPIGVQGIARDLTERKHSERALRESQAFFDSFMDNSPAVAFMKDAQGRYVYVNKPFERLFGQKLSFLEGKTSYDWLPPETAQLTHTHDLEVLATGRPQEIIESVPTGDGTPHHWLVFKFPTTDSLGNRFVAGVGVDISGRQRAEEALAQQAQREAMTHRISQAIRCSLDSREIFQTAVRELGSYLNVDRCSLFMRDERSTRVTNVAEYHTDGVEPAGSDFKLEHLQPLIKPLDEMGFLAFDDAANDSRIVRLYEDILKKASVQSIMYVAIRVGDDLPAAFSLSTTKNKRKWTESDIALAKAVADQTGIAIRQAKLYQKAEATSTREALVNRVTMAIRASLKLPDVLSTATKELGEAISASRVHLYLTNDEESNSPLEYEYLSEGVGSIKHLEVTYDDPIGRRLQETTEPLVIDDSLNYVEGSDELSAFVRSHARELNLRSQINYPVLVKGQFRGVLCIHQTDRLRCWTEDELLLVDSVAERLGIGIAQAELFQMVARAKTEWETTFDSMSDGIFIFDQTGALRRVNRAGAAMEAVHPRILLGRKCCDILRTGEEASCIVEKALEGGRSETIEITPRRLNRPLLVTIEPILNENNKAVAVVCTARDLSELRKAQAVAREHQSLLTNILESARESIYAVDPEGRFKWSNSATLKGLGYQRSDLIGRHLMEMVYDGDQALVQQKLDAALDGQPQTYEMRYFSHSGGLRYARVDNSPLVVDGKTTGVLGIARDITEQKEERERAARADKLRALGQLASGVAHDFNNSLAAILGRAQLLRRQVKDEALVRNLNIIQTAAEDAAATVRRIQTFARKSPVKEFELLDVCSLLNDAVEITRTRWENEARLRGLEYDVRLEADTDSHSYGSASELREVFVNLIVNAVDAMPKGGKLSISCRRLHDQLQLQFADTGMGMPEDVQQKIFEPFFSTKGAHGTGLGLSVSYSIIERHEGKISVSSEPDKGTTFTIELPVGVPESLTELKPLNEELSGLRILVVDDETAVRETLAEMLVAANHEVGMAEGGQDAVQQLRGKSFDFVFTDLAMPEMDGWETARAIRKEWPQMKIVLVTGYGSTATPPEGEENLVDAIIGKPFNFGQVSSTLLTLKTPTKELLNV